MQRSFASSSALFSFFSFLSSCSSSCITHRHEGRKKFLGVINDRVCGSASYSLALSFSSIKYGRRRRRRRRRRKKRFGRWAFNYTKWRPGTAFHKGLAYRPNAQASSTENPFFLRFLLLLLRLLLSLDPRGERRRERGGCHGRRPLFPSIFTISPPFLHNGVLEELFFFSFVSFLSSPRPFASSTHERCCCCCSSVTKENTLSKGGNFF